MSRILLLLIFLLWMAWSEAPLRSAHPLDQQIAGTVIFIGVYGLLVLAMRAWSGLLSRHVSADNFDRKLRRFNKVMFITRLFVPAWFGVALYALYWGETVESLWLPFAPRRTDPLSIAQFPSIVLGTLPAFAAWVGLWWSQFPADRALREQNILLQVDSGLPVYPPPGLRQYLLANLRMQVLFTIVPILLILLVRDIAAVAYFAAWREPPRQAIELAISLVAAGLVFLFAPEILRRVLHTQPLPDSPLRRRLEALCRRTGMRYRDILLWRTQNNMGNAAVMGLVPQVRYILLSDLLLERMDDEQIEAVFAHEVGHVVHSHMAWFVVFFIIFFGGLLVAGEYLGGPLVDELKSLGLPEAAMAPMSVVGMAAGFLVLFGYLSRRFERQADVYAARTMEARRWEPPQPHLIPAHAAVALEPAGFPAHGAARQAVQGAVPAPASPAASHVGHYGATLFASALHRVAVINNIPLSPRRRRRGLGGRRVTSLLDEVVDAANNWFHGSITHRMDYLRDLSADPALTTRFDRLMLRLYCCLLFALFASAAAFVGTILRT